MKESGTQLNPEAIESFDERMAFYRKLARRDEVKELQKRLGQNNDYQGERLVDQLMGERALTHKVLAEIKHILELTMPEGCGRDYVNRRIKELLKVID
ncbi:MAG TPA: hypothetical protein V6D22_17025 [Candidatus Obscuribacterales bacterium]